MPPLQQPGPKPRNAYGRMNPMENLEKFAQEVSAIINKRLPSYDKPYRQVSVLAFHWGNNDIGVAPLEAELLDVFQKIYGFNVESFTIPATFAGLRILDKKFCDFREKWDAEDALTIYIYSGHAEEANLAGCDYKLGGRANDSGRIVGPRMNWSQMRIIPETAVGDVLYILGTCFAPSAATYDGPEVLATVSVGGVSAANLQTSLTRILTDELKALSGAPCPVACIYSSIHQYAITNNLERGPVHIPKKGKESIVLAKFHSPKQEKPEPNTTRKRRINALEPSEHRVLITVNLQENTHIPDIEEWKKWLTTNIPSHRLSSNITIEGLCNTELTNSPN